MNTIKINFCNTSGYEFDAKKNIILSILKKHYDIEISDNPDYVIVGNDGKPFDFARYNCIRIMLATENFSPDFTLFDYWIGFDELSFGDRYFKLPLAFQFADGKPWRPDIITKEAAEALLKEKKHFCNFVYRHPSSHGIRELLNSQLNNYKKVVSPGNYLNNISGEVVSHTELKMKRFCSVEEKLQYLKDSKFTIACDSVCYPGFVTEKILDAFKCHSIPIYFGAPNIDTYFNPNSFIWCKSEKHLDEVVDRVIFLDTHDEDYLKMLMECPLNDPDYVVDEYVKLEKFLLNIFSQPISDAKRRPQYYLVDYYNSNLQFAATSIERHNKPYKKRYRKAKRKIKSIIKKMWKKFT